jgi:undecaprenyl-diphosphatase
MSPPHTPVAVRAWRFARSEAAPLAAIAVLAAALATFLHLVSEVIYEGEGHGFDLAVLNALRAGGDPGRPVGPWALKTAATDLTALGSVSVLTLIVAVVAGFLLIQRKFAAAVLVVAAPGGGALLSWWLKALFARERPPESYRVVEAINPSFPSGHAMLSAVVYLTLGALLARALPRKRERAYVLAVGIVLTALVGLTRVYLGVHWATDVLAGWSVGAAWATACWLASFAVERFTRRSIATPQGG